MAKAQSALGTIWIEEDGKSGCSEYKNKHEKKESNVSMNAKRMWRAQVSCFTKSMT